MRMRYYQKFIETFNSLTGLPKPQYFNLSLL